MKLRDAALCKQNKSCAFDVSHKQNVVSKRRREAFISRSSCQRCFWCVLCALAGHALFTSTSSSCCSWTPVEPIGVSSARPRIPSSVMNSEVQTLTCICLVQLVTSEETLLIIIDWSLFSTQSRFLGSVNTVHATFHFH